MSALSFRVPLDSSMRLCASRRRCGVTRSSGTSLRAAVALSFHCLQLRRVNPVLAAGAARLCDVQAEQALSTQQHAADTAESRHIEEFDIASDLHAGEHRA